MNRTTPMKPGDDVRETPPWLYNQQNARFRFTLDACATHANAKCARYFTESGRFVGGQWQSAEHGLSGSWAGERVWCNPPFSDIGAWVLKAWESGAELVCMLVPATRTEQGWWQDGVEPYRDGRPAPEGTMLHLSTEFIPGRVKFLENGGPIYRKNKDGSLWLHPETGQPAVSSPKFGCVLLIWR